MTAYWWLRHDWIKYKVPVEEGRVIIPQDYLIPGFVPDPRELRYSYVKGRRDTRKIADFSGWDDGVFFVNERAHAVFKPMFDRHGRSYPVDCSGRPHYLVWIDTLIDAFDDRRSTVDRHGFEADLKEDISRIRHVVLRPGFSTDADIFRLDGSYAMWRNIIVSDRFRELYESHGFTGLLFKQTANPLTKRST